MSHNTVFGGASREIEGGTPLIGGVAREIESGLVLVNGVAREIEFGGGVVTVKTVGSGDSSHCYIKINGTTYAGAATIEVQPGTTIEVHSRDAGVAGLAEQYIYLNGVQVATSDYSYTVNSNVTITFVSTFNSIFSITFYAIKIVEE